MSRCFFVCLVKNLCCVLFFVIHFVSFGFFSMIFSVLKYFFNQLYQSFLDEFLWQMFLMNVFDNYFENFWKCIGFCHFHCKYDPLLTISYQMVYQSSKTIIGMVIFGHYLAIPVIVIGKYFLYKSVNLEWKVQSDFVRWSFTISCFLAFHWFTKTKINFEIQKHFRKTKQQNV